MKRQWVDAEGATPRLRGDAASTHALIRAAFQKDNQRSSLAALRNASTIR